MTLANRLRTRMFWRGIRSQTQLARLSGVSQSSIHHILTLGDAYAVQRETLRRLAAALGTSPAWLSGEADGLPSLQEPGVPYATDGYDAEMQALMARLSSPARRKIVDIVRLIAESNPANGAPGGEKPSGLAPALDDSDS
jgi:transcriptional regulator with XRE-family HTH domain